MKKFISKTLTFVCVLWLVWVAASFLDVVANNLDPNPTYAVWNVFAMLF